MGKMKIDDLPPHAVSGMKKMNGALKDFYDASNSGELRYVQALMSHWAGGPIPAPEVLRLLRVSMEEMGARAGPPKCAFQQLFSGLGRMLDEGDDIPELEAKINAISGTLRARKTLHSVSFDDAKALEYERRLLEHLRRTGAEEGSDLREHIEGIRSAHDEWAGKDEAARADPAEWPIVKQGPNLLHVDKVLMQVHGEVLSDAEKAAVGLLPDENGIGFLMQRLAPHRSKCGSEVRAIQHERVAWYLDQIGGVEAGQETLTEDKLKAAAKALSTALRQPAFTQKVDETLADASIGPAGHRWREVEKQIAQAESEAAEAAGLGQGYPGVVRLAGLRALAFERYGDKATRPDKDALAACDEIRSKVEERFYRKSWLPLESNPDVFNVLGRRLGLPQSVEFFEVFGLDPELLQMVPSPAHAVLVCFPLTDEYVEGCNAAKGATAPPGTYFLKQTVPNACGTIALLHAFANLPAEHRGAAEGWLAEFAARTVDKDPLQRAVALEEDDKLAITHNTMAEEGDTNVANFSGDSSWNTVLHFVCFVCCDGQLVELDGIKDGPVAHGPTTPEKLLQDSAERVMALIEGKEDEIRVNMMVLSTTPAASD